MKPKIKITTIGLAMIMIAGAALAQSQNDKTQLKRSGDTEQKSHMAIREDHSRLDFQPKLVKVENLIGAEVVNAPGEELGTVRDLMINSSGSNVGRVVIGQGGLMGLGETLHSVAWNEITIQSHREVGEGDDDTGVKVMLKTTLEQFKNRKTFAYDDESDWDSDDPHREDKTATRDGDLDDGTRTRSHIAARRVSEILDKPIHNSKDERIGEVEDILIDTNEGHLAYAIIDIEDGLIDLDPEVASIPWPALRDRGEHMQYSMGNETLGHLAYEKSSMDRLEDREFASQCAQKTGTDPYWMTGAVAANEEHNPDHQVVAGTEGRDNKHKGSLDGSAVQVSGRVINVPSQATASEPMRVEIKTDDGRTVTVLCGMDMRGKKDGYKTSSTQGAMRNPNRDEDESKNRMHALKLKKGDVITVSGLKTTMENGQSAITAEKVEREGEIFTGEQHKNQ